MEAWLHSPPGRYALAWEQERLDLAVADAFGFHALQLGLPQLQALRANRMPHRWLASDSLRVPELLELPAPSDGSVNTLSPPLGACLHCEFDALPLPNHSIDLAVLPHTLELARDPHLTLREVERVLVPDGRLVITGFNPASVWGLRQRASLAKRSMGFGKDKTHFLPDPGDFIGYWRLRDWLRLLGFELESGRFGCFRPPLKTHAWLERWDWIDAVGDRWWPVLGAVYELTAVKRVRGMRLVGLLPREKRKASAPATVVNRDTAARASASHKMEVDV